MRRYDREWNKPRPTEPRSTRHSMKSAAFSGPRKHAGRHGRYRVWVRDEGGRWRLQTETDSLARALLSVTNLRLFRDLETRVYRGGKRYA